MSPATIVAQARAQLEGGKPVRYAAVSAVAVVVGQFALWVGSAVLDLTPVWANFCSVTVGCVPSYLLNRYWVWGKRGRNHFWREVVPFWVMALIGLGFSTVLVAIASRWSDATWVVSVANLTAFGILWVAKYLILDAVLFRLAPATAGADTSLV
jgi:putative flippase GtrA